MCGESDLPQPEAQSLLTYLCKSLYTRLDTTKTPKAHKQPWYCQKPCSFSRLNLSTSGASAPAKIMDPRIVMMMRQMQLEIQMRAQLEEAQMQNMIPRQRLQMAEQQRIRAMMMAAQREQMMEAQQEQMIMAAYRQQMMAEQMRMAGGGAGGPMPPGGMPFLRGPMFSPGGMRRPGPDPRNHPRTESPDNTSDSDGPRDARPGGGSPGHAGVRNGRPGVVYGDWEVEEVEDEK